MIGTRSLGSDPCAWRRWAPAFAAGLERGGILPGAANIFRARVRSRSIRITRCPTIDADAVDTARRAIWFHLRRSPKHAPAIMGAHAVVRAFDPDAPVNAVASHRDRLLRGELGFGGAFVTDCLQMAAPDATRRAGSVAVAALAAGADLLTVSHERRTGAGDRGAIVRAVVDRSLSRERLQEAYERVDATARGGGD